MLTSVLPIGSRARTLAITAAAFVVAAIYVQFVLPGTPGGGRGTPMAILFNGFVQGCGVAITALGLVLVYRSLRVINFAQAAIGAVGGRLFFEFVQFTQVPFPIALLLGIAAGALVGVIFDLVFGRRFFNHPRIVLTTATIMALGTAVWLSTLAASLPIFPRTSERSLQETTGDVVSRPFLPFSGWEFQVGDFPTRYGFPEVLAIELMVLAVIAVVCFLRYTRAGVAVRALSENSERASLLGIPVGNLSTIVWGIAGALSTLTVVSVGALSSPSAATRSGAAIPVLLAPLTAAVIARFQSIPIAVTTSLLMGVVANAVRFSYPEDAALVQVAYFLIVAAVLVIQRRRAGRSEEGAGVAWTAVKEPRPIPKELAKVGTVRTSRWALLAVLGLFVIIWPVITPARFQFLGGQILVLAIIGVSVVVLTGWAGQISLAQFAFAGVGGVVAASLTTRQDIPFWFAVPIAAAIAGVVALLIGIPALRLKGLFLAVTTLAFAIAVEQVLFDERYFGWLLPETAERPSLFFLNFDQDRTMYYLCLVCLVIAIVIATNLRRSRFGRLLIAMRENEANVQSFGVSAVRLKLTAFAVSGALAGFAGAVFVHQQRGVSAASFGSQRSLDAFIFTVLGGVGSVLGAMLGSLWDNLFRYFLPSNEFLAVVSNALQTGGGPLLVLFVLPAGLISVVIGMRDGWLRIIAQRRQIVVPSLFADYDPAALEHRLIPLAEASANSGLAALGPGAHFRLGSELHGGATDGGPAALQGRDEDRLAIGAAVAAVGDVGAEAPHDVVGATLVAVRDEEDE